MALATPYKSGTVSSSTGVTFTATSSTFSSGDVGRLLVLTSGAGILQHRKIVTFISTTVVEIDHSFDSTPWLDTAVDVNPSNGDTFAISYLQSDSAFTSEPGVSVSGEQIDISALILSNNAYILIENSQVDLLSSGIEINANSGMIFGWYKYIQGEDSQVTNSVHMVDRSVGVFGNQWAGTTFGMLDIYGGTILIDHGGEGNFWRTNGVNACVRIINVACYGNPGLGCRVSGSRSIFIISQVGSSNVNGPVNPLSDVSRVGITSVDSLQAGYVFLYLGPSGRFVFDRLNSVSSRVIRCLSNNHSGTNVIEVIAKKSEIDAAPKFIESTETPSGTHTFRYGNIIKPIFLDESAVLFIDDIKTVLLDSTSTTINTVTISDGVYPDFFSRHTDIATVAGDLNLSDGILYAPNSLNIIAWLKQIVSQVISVEDTFDFPITLLNDLSLTETNKTIVDAYTEIETPQKLYDRAKAYLYDNYSGESSPLIIRSNSSVDLGAYDLVIDASATPAFSLSGNTITIHADNYTGDITTTGAVSFANGATITGGIIDSNGDSFLLFEGVDSWEVYSDPGRTILLDSGTTGSYRFNYSGGTTYYLNLTVTGETFQKFVTPTQPGGTTISLSDTALLNTISIQVSAISAVQPDNKPTVGADGKIMINENQVSDIITG